MGEEGEVKREEEFERAWMAGGNAAQEHSDQIRSDHGMSFSQQAIAWGCLGAWVQGCTHGYTVTWAPTQGYPTEAKSKVSRADRSSLRQIGVGRVSRLRPASAAWYVTVRSIQRAASLQIPPTRASRAPGHPSSVRLAPSSPGTTPVGLLASPPWIGPTKKFRTPILDFDFSTPPKKASRYHTPLAPSPPPPPS